jgi:MSHA pilin protein MshC
VRVFALKSQRGFTLIELVMVIVMLGVLAVFAVPKMSGPSAFNVRGFHDETLAYLRYAQSTAVAQRRTVCVVFTSNAVQLSLASLSTPYVCLASAKLAGPRGEPQASATAKSGVNYEKGLAPSAFFFDALGQPVDATGSTLAKQTLHVTDDLVTTVNDTGSNGVLRIVVEAVTGYVHE